MNPDIPTPVSPRKNNKIMLVAGIGFGLILVLLVAVLLIRHQSQSSKTAASKRQAVVEITANGFTPSTLKVTAGTPIVWRNTDSAPHVVASNPYPKDSSVSGLHSQTILPDSSYTYVPSASGTISYHDDLMPTHNAVLTVQ